MNDCGRMYVGKYILFDYINNALTGYTRHIPQNALVPLVSSHHRRWGMWIIYVDVIVVFQDASII